MKENCNSGESDSEEYVMSNNVSKKNNKPSSSMLEMLSNQNRLEVMLPFLNPKERAKLSLCNKNIMKVSSGTTCIRKDKLYIDYLYFISNNPAIFEEIANNIFESDYEQLNKKLVDAEKEIQNRFHFDKEKKEIMACMKPYLKICMYQMVLVEILSLTRNNFDTDCVKSDSEISECIENIIKNNRENQKKRIDKILALGKNEQTKEAKTLTENKQITEIKDFWAEIKEIRGNETCEKIKKNNENELRDLMYQCLLYGCKTILPEIYQCCDAKNKTVYEIQVEIAKNQSEIEEYEKKLPDLQQQAKNWNDELQSRNNIFNKLQNMLENKKSEIEQNQLSIENLEDKSVLSNGDLKILLDDTKQLINSLNEKIKINKEDQEKIEKAINNKKQNIAEFQCQISELDVQKEIVKNINSADIGTKLSDYIFNYLLDNPNNINISMLQIINEVCRSEDCVYYDSNVDFVSKFIRHSLEHHKHKNFLLAIIEASKILHELLESNYSQEEEKRWRRSYYKYYNRSEEQNEYFKDKMNAWGYKYGNSIRRTLCNTYDEYDDVYRFIGDFLLDGSYAYSWRVSSRIYSLRFWLTEIESYNWMHLFDMNFGSAALAFALISGLCGAVLLFIYFIAGTCVVFFNVLSFLCALVVTTIVSYIVYKIKFKATDKKLTLAIDKNKEDLQTGFIKSHMWWQLFPHGFMWTAISFAIASGHVGAVSLSLYYTGVAACSGVLYFSLILAACSAVSFIIFGIRVWIQKRKYEDWTSQMNKLQEDRKNINKPLKLKRFYDKFVNQNNQKLNLIEPITNTNTNTNTNNNDMQKYN